MNSRKIIEQDLIELSARSSHSGRSKRSTKLPVILEEDELGQDNENSDKFESKEHESSSPYILKCKQRSTVEPLPKIDQGPKPPIDIKSLLKNMKWNQTEKNIRFIDQFDKLNKEKEIEREKELEKARERELEKQKERETRRLLNQQANQQAQAQNIPQTAWQNFTPKKFIPPPKPQLPCFSGAPRINPNRITPELPRVQPENLEREQTQRQTNTSFIIPENNNKITKTQSEIKMATENQQQIAQKKNEAELLNKKPNDVLGNTNFDAKPTAKELSCLNAKSENLQNNEKLKSTITDSKNLSQLISRKQKAPMKDKRPYLNQLPGFPARKLAFIDLTDSDEKHSSDENEDKNPEYIKLQKEVALVEARLEFLNNNPDFVPESMEFDPEKALESLTKTKNHANELDCGSNSNEDERKLDINLPKEIEAPIQKLNKSHKIVTAERILAEDCSKEPKPLKTFNPKVKEIAEGELFDPNTQKQYQELKKSDNEMAKVKEQLQHQVLEGTVLKSSDGVVPESQIELQISPQVNVKKITSLEQITVIEQNKAEIESSENTISDTKSKLELLQNSQNKAHEETDKEQEGNEIEEEEGDKIAEEGGEVEGECEEVAEESEKLLEEGEEGEEIEEEEQGEEIEEEEQEEESENDNDEEWEDEENGNSQVVSIKSPIIEATKEVDKVTKEVVKPKGEIVEAPQRRKLIEILKRMNRITSVKPNNYGPELENSGEVKQSEENQNADSTDYDDIPKTSNLEKSNQEDDLAVVAKTLPQTPADCESVASQEEVIKQNLLTPQELLLECKSQIDEAFSSFSESKVLPKSKVQEDENLSTEILLTKSLENQDKLKPMNQANFEFNGKCIDAEDQIKSFFLGSQTNSKQRQEDMIDVIITSERGMEAGDLKEHSNGESQIKSMHESSLRSINEEKPERNLKRQPSSLKCNVEKHKNRSEVDLEMPKCEVINVFPFLPNVKKTVTDGTRIKYVEVKCSDTFESESDDSIQRIIPEEEDTEVQRFKSNSFSDETKSIKLESVHLSYPTSDSNNDNFNCHLYKLKLRVKSITWQTHEKIKSVILRFYNPFTREMATVNRKFVLPYIYTADIYCYIPYICLPEMIKTSLSHYGPHILLYKKTSDEELARGTLSLRKSQLELKESFNTIVPLVKDGKQLAEALVSLRLFNAGPIPESDEKENGVIQIIFKEMKNTSLESEVAKPQRKYKKTKYYKLFQTPEEYNYDKEDDSSSENCSSSEVPQDKAFKNKQFLYNKDKKGESEVKKPQKEYKKSKHYQPIQTTIEYTSNKVSHGKAFKKKPFLYKSDKKSESVIAKPRKEYGKSKHYVPIQTAEEYNSGQKHYSSSDKCNSSEVPHSKPFQKKPFLYKKSESGIAKPQKEFRKSKHYEPIQTTVEYNYYLDNCNYNELPHGKAFKKSPFLNKKDKKSESGVAKQHKEYRKSKHYEPIQTTEEYNSGQEDTSSSDNCISGEVTHGKSFNRKPFLYKKDKKSEASKAKRQSHNESFLTTSSIFVQTESTKPPKSFINNCKDIQTDVPQEDQVDTKKSRIALDQTKIEFSKVSVAESKVTQTETITKEPEATRYFKDEQTKKKNKVNISQTLIAKSAPNEESLDSDNSTFEKPKDLQKNILKTLKREQEVEVKRKEKKDSVSVTVEKSSEMEVKIVVKKAKESLPKLKHENHLLVHEEEHEDRIKEKSIKTEEVKIKKLKRKLRLAPEKIDVRMSEVRAESIEKDSFDSLEQTVDEQTPYAVRQYLEGKKLVEQFFKVCIECKPAPFDKITSEKLKKFKTKYLRGLRAKLSSDFETPSGTGDIQEDESEKRWMSYMAAFLHKREKGRDEDNSSIDNTENQISELQSEVAQHDILINNPDYYEERKFYSPELCTADVTTSTAYPLIFPSTAEAAIQANPRATTTFSAQTKETTLNRIPIIKRKSVLKCSVLLDPCLIIMDTISCARNGNEKFVNKNILYEKIREHDELQQDKIQETEKPKVPYEKIRTYDKSIQYEAEVIKTPKVFEERLKKPIEIIDIKRSKYSNLTRSLLIEKTFFRPSCESIKENESIKDLHGELQDFLKNISLEIHYLKHRVQDLQKNGNGDYTYAPPVNTNFDKKNFSVLVANDEERDFKVVFCELQQLQNLVYNTFKKFSQRYLDKLETRSRSKQGKNVNNYESQDKELKLMFENPKVINKQIKTNVRDGSQTAHSLPNMKSEVILSSKLNDSSSESSDTVIITKYRNKRMSNKTSRSGYKSKESQSSLTLLNQKSSSSSLSTLHSGRPIEIEMNQMEAIKEKMSEVQLKLRNYMQDKESYNKNNDEPVTGDHSNILKLLHEWRRLKSYIEQVCEV